MYTALIHGTWSLVSRSRARPLYSARAVSIDHDLLSIALEYEFELPYFA